MPPGNRQAASISTGFAGEPMEGDLNFRFQEPKATRTERPHATPQTPATNPNATTVTKLRHRRKKPPAHLATANHTNNDDYLTTGLQPTYVPNSVETERSRHNSRRSERYRYRSRAQKPWEGGGGSPRAYGGARIFRRYGCCAWSGLGIESFSELAMVPIRGAGRRRLDGVA